MSCHFPGNLIIFILSLHVIILSAKTQNKSVVDCRLSRNFKYSEDNAYRRKMNKRRHGLSWLSFCQSFIHFVSALEFSSFFLNFNSTYIFFSGSYNLVPFSNFRISNALHFSHFQDRFDII
jgi:hypothetical protein